MMSFDESMREIESHKVAVHLNVTSGLKNFLKAIQEETAVSALLEQLDSPEKYLKIFSRVIELSKQLVDPRYENQWDIALAIYVWMLSLVNFKLAIMASEIVIQIPRCWWATKISQNLKNFCERF